MSRTIKTLKKREPEEFTLRRISASRIKLEPALCNGMHVISVDGNGINAGEDQYAAELLTEDLKQYYGTKR